MASGVCSLGLHELIKMTQNSLLSFLGMNVSLKVKNYVKNHALYLNEEGEVSLDLSHKILFSLSILFVKL